MSLPQIGPWTFTDQNIGALTGNIDSVFALLGACSKDDGTGGNVLTFATGSQSSDVLSRIGVGPGAEALALQLALTGLPAYFVPVQSTPGTFGTVTPSRLNIPEVLVGGVVGYPGVSIPALGTPSGNGTVAFSSTSRATLNFGTVEIDVTATGVIDGNVAACTIKLDGVTVATAVPIVSTPVTIPIFSSGPASGMLLSFNMPPSGSFVNGDKYSISTSTPADTYLIEIGISSTGLIGTFPLMKFNYSLDGGNTTSGNINAIPAALPLLTGANSAPNAYLLGSPVNPVAPNLLVDVVTNTSSTAGGNPTVVQPATTGSVFLDPSTAPVGVFSGSSGTTGTLHITITGSGVPGVATIRVQIGTITNPTTPTPTYEDVMPTGLFNIPNVTGLTGVQIYFKGTFTSADIPTVAVTQPAVVKFAVDGSTLNDTALILPLGNPAAWIASHAYTHGVRVINGGNLYGCTVAGTSAASGGPSGTGGVITDGGATWAYLSSPANAIVSISTLVLNGVISSVTTNTGLSIVVPNGAQNFSSTGPMSWAANFADSPAFTYLVKEQSGDFTGVAIGFAYGAYTSGDSYTCTTVAPFCTKADFDTALTTLFAKTGIAFSMMHLVGGPNTFTNTAVLVEDVAAQLDALPDAVLKFYRAVIDGPYLPSTTTGGTPSDAATAFASVGAPRCMVAGGTDETVSSLTQRIQQRPYGWSLMPRLGQVPIIANDPGWAQLGRLDNVNLPQEGNPPNTSNDDASAFDDTRVAAAYAPVQVTGVYPVRGITLADNGSDYFLIERGRVMDKACRILATALFPFLNGNIPYATGGVVDPTWASNQEKAISNVIASGLPVGSDPQQFNAPTVSVRFNRTANVKATGQLPVTVTIGAWAYVFQIPVTIGFGA